MTNSLWSSSDEITVQLIDLISIVLLLVLGLVLAVSYGFQYLLQGPHRELYFALFTVPFAACIIALLIIPFVWARPDSRIVHLPRGIGLLPMFAMFSASVYFYADNPTALSAIGLSSIAVLIAYARCGFDTAAYLIIAAGFALFCILLVTNPIDTNNADMLPIIEAAARVYLHGGDVYVADYSKVTGNPFFYLPLQWMIYVPFVATEIDMRLLHVALAGSTIILFVTFLRQNVKRAMMLTFWPVLLSPVSASMFFAGQVWPFWFLMIAFLIAFINERFFLSALMLGMMLAMRQTSLVIAAAVAIFMISRIPVRKYLILMMIVMLVHLALTVPFVGRDVSVYLSLYIPSDAIERSLTILRNPMNQVALVNWLYVSGIESIRSILQIATGGVFLLIIFLARGRSVGMFLILMGVMYLVVISLNGQVFRYYYIPGLIAAALGTALSVASGGVRSFSDQPIAQT